jgi:hypothetical protein
MAAAPALALVPATPRLDELEFYERDHRYIVRGRQLPSVTQIMREVGLGFTGFAPQEALDRGTYCHDASVYIDTGDFWWTDPELPEQWRGYLLGYQELVRITRSTPIAAEWGFWHPLYGFAGRLDRVIIRDGRYGLVEIKTGSTRHVWIQGGGYRIGWDYWRPDAPLSFAECWKLNATGPADRFAIDLDLGAAEFSAALTVFRRRGEPR